MQNILNMGRSYLLLFAVIFFPWRVSAQLVVDTSATAEQLVQTLVGPGVTISNVTQPINFFEPGYPWMGSGTFTATGTNLGMGSGIILGSGPVMYAPWAPTQLSTQYIWTYGDDDLTVLAGGIVGSPFAITKDASILEFDFVPNGDSLKFRYVFASDEYPEWVCSQYNDVFGFFLSGPGINGPFSNNSVNLAVLPGTNIPIAVNTVNSGQVGGITFPYPASNCAESDPNWQNNSIYFVVNDSGPYVGYDGFTVVLEAVAAVQCGETYHIKLAIADFVDAFYDSTVFLEGGSFTSTGEPGGVSLVPGIGISGDTLTEGCPAQFMILRNGDISTAATFDLVVGGTATAGVDYASSFPAEITFAPGETSQTISVDVPIDGDPLETIVLTLTGLMTCAGAADAEFTFFIEPAAPLEVELADASLGCGVEQVLEPLVIGGVGAYEYLWSTGETTPSITVQPIVDTEYEVSVSDGCSVVPVTVSALVTLDSEPIAIEVSPDVDVPCDEQSQIEVIQVTGGIAPYTYEWTVDGAIAGTTQSIFVSGADPTWYVVSVTDDCGDLVSDSVLVSSMDPPVLEVDVSPQTDLPCDEEVIVSVLDVQGGDPPYQYEWLYDGQVIGTSADLTVEDPGWYVVSVTEGCGGLGVDSVLVSPQSIGPLLVTASDDVQVPCEEEASITVIDVEDGNGMYTYTWTVGNDTVGTGISLSVTGGSPTWYVVTVVDGCGAMGQDSVLVSASPGAELLVTMNAEVSVVCPGDTALLQVLNVEGATGPLTYTWTNAAGQEVGTGSILEVLVTQAEPFLVTASDACGNSGSAAVTTQLNVVPLQLQLPEDLLICAGDEVELFAVVNGGSGYYFINWHGLEHTDPILTVSPTQTTQYTVTISDQCGQTITQSVTVQVEQANVNILETNTGPDDWYLQAVTTPSASTWIWDMGDGTRYREAQITHSYVDLEEHWVHLTITTASGCIAVDSVLLTTPANIHFPNAFTPDGDGFNDLFGSVGHSITEFELEIFNRWGELIFRTDDPDRWWDGTYKGTPVQTGVYVYKFSAAGHYFPATEGFGHVTLLRGDLE